MNDTDARGWPPGRIMLLLVLACSLLCAAAQAVAPSLRFRKLGPLGNEEPSMLSLLQDRHGFMWIGTQSNGLYRYDGYHASKYRSKAGDPRKLPHDRVAALFEDQRGRLWAGTQDGLARFNRESNDFTTFVPPKVPNNGRNIKAIVADGQDGMWLATWGGLQHFNPSSGAFVQYVHDPARPSSLASNDLNALAVDARGGVWAATWPGGLDYLPPGATAFEHRRVDKGQDPNARPNIVRALRFDQQGVLWIGTEAGVLRWDSRQPWETRTAVASPDSRVTSLYFDRDGTLWATTLSAGLLRWDAAAGRFDQYGHNSDDPYSLPGDNLRSMLQDRGGMLWIASFTDGIALVNLSSSGFTRHLPYRLDGRHGRASNALLSLENGPDGTLWLGGNMGIGLYDPARGEVRRRYQADGRPGALSNNIAYSMYQDPKGPLWVGTANGLNRLDQPGGTFKLIRFGDTASDFVNAIAPGRDGVLWLGTGNSLVRYDPLRERSTLFYHDPHDPHSRSVGGTSVVLEDRQGRVWMGSEFNGGGLDLLEPGSGKFRHLRSGGPEGMIDDNVVSLHEDAEGRLWIGTARGVVQLDETGGGLRLRSHAAAVQHLKALAIQSDAKGKIWVSTLAGLFRLNPSNGSAQLFTVADGMTDGFTANASAPGTDGQLYFGGVHGMTGIAPDQVRSASVPPQVAITDIKLFNHSLREGRFRDQARLEGPLTAPTGLVLSSQASAFTIEFAALHYTEPSQNRYAYQLEGFDPDWQETDAERRVATYTNLDPGRYVFRVRAANHHGSWSEAAATLNVTITPPFWQALWFRSGAAVLLLGSLWSLYRWRIRRLTRLQAELAQQVAARTAELEDSNRKLEALSQTDGLTGVGNRRGFDLALEAEWRRAARTGQPLALSMLDVDYFKKYNDRYGHLAGDATLRAVARVITEHGRRSSDLVARYGGEEFALLSVATPGADAIGVAHTICSELSLLQLPHDASPFGHVTISIGVAVLVPTEHSRPEQLLRLADEALYRAKQRGRNQALLALEE
ncbi:ligand-binding sensor domain-containing diguanylate cyclase [Pseudoduganella violaceinigra]|uniref:ligand-binding sensor domain-containing diguanylate cyclase n=1 Tax=Pseudoduganella violaceinigra TaxID=246602 RepID=UPI000685DBF4|nr:ligand-binding sensor domain-containing diguanylate cyclase [Pseudoduganella violaceinigra]